MSDAAGNSTEGGAERAVGCAFKVVLALVGMAAAVFASTNWCFVGLPALVAVLMADLFLDATILKRRSRRALWLLLRLAVCVAVGAVVGTLLNMGPDTAFREAMGIDPPAGVQVTKVQRHYAGGGGDHSLIVEFTADEPVVKSLIPTRVVEGSSDSHEIRAWSAAGRTWEAALKCFSCLNSQPFVKMSWMRIRPLENPQVYDFGGVNNGDLVLLYDAASKRGILLHSR